MTPARRLWTRVALVVGALLLLAAAFVGWGVWRAANPPLPPPLGELAAVRVTDAAGRAVPLTALARPGAATVLSFWASWCRPCIEEARTLHALREEHGAALSIVYLNVDRNRSADGDRRFWTAAGVPPLPDHAADAAAYRAITGQSMVALPRTYVFDRVGQPTTVLVGYAEGETSATLRAAVAAAVVR